MFVSGIYAHSGNTIRQCRFYGRYEVLIKNDVLRRNRISVGEILYTRRIEDVWVLEKVK